MEFPKGGIVGRTMNAVRRVQAMKIPGHAANAGYFIVLSVFPALVLILSLLRYTALDAGDLLDLLAGILPAALMDAAEKLIISTYAHTGAAMVGVSAAGALWSASRGIYGLTAGLNSVYGVTEDRGYFRTRLMSMLYTFGFLLLLLLTLVLHVFGTGLLRWLPLEESPLLRFLENILDLRFFLLLFLQTAMFTAMFTVLPNKRNSLGDSFPGAVLASICWLVFSELYSVYVEHFAGFSNVFGSVYAVALSMLWLYCCVSIVFYGGALNRWLAERNKG